MKKLIATLLAFVILCSFASCGKEAETDVPKNIYSEGGVKISTDAFPEDTELKVETLKNDDTKYQVARTVLPNAVKIDAYEITAESKGVAVQPDGTVKVTFPVPKSYDSAKHNIEVYYISDDGIAEKISAKLEKDGVVAELKHFSTYAVILVEKTADTTSGDNTSSDATSSDTTSSDPSSSEGSSSSGSDTSSSNTSSKPEKVNVPKLSKTQVEDMFGNFKWANMAAYDNSDEPYGCLYNADLKNLDNLTAISFIYYYCNDELQQYVDTSAEFPTIVVPKSVLDDLAKRYLGYTYDFTKSYTFDDFVVAINYDSKTKKVTFTEGGGGMGGPDGFKVMSYSQKDDTLTINLKYHLLTEGTPSGVEGTDWANAEQYGYEGCYFELTDSAALTYKYIDGYWRIISFKAK